MRASVVHLALALVFAALAAMLFRDISRPFGNGDEVVYAQGVREMVATGDYLTLRWFGEPVLERPTTAFVVPALLTQVVDHETGLRLFPVLCSLMVLVMSFRLARRLRLGRDTSVVAAVLLTGVSSYHLFSRSLLTDPFYLVAVFAAVVATIRAQRDARLLPWVGAALGLAVAIKSLAAAVPLVALAPFLIGPIRTAGRRRVAITAATFLALATPYYLVMLAMHGGEFWSLHFGSTLFDRAQGRLAMGMPGGIAAYAVYTWQAEGPAMTILLLSGCVGCIVLGSREGRRDLLIVGSFPLACFALLSLVGTRLPHYLLICYPPAAVAAAALLERARAQLSDSIVTRAVPVALAVALLMEGITTTPDEHFLPSEPAVRLGLVAEQIAYRHEEVVYTFGWYAPAVAYYGGRRWVMLTRSETLFERLNSLAHFRRAGVVRHPPPWPGTTRPILVAGRESDLARLPGVVKSVASTDGFVLARVLLFDLPGASP